MSYLTRSRLRAVCTSSDVTSASEREASPKLTLFQRLATPKRAKRQPTKRSRDESSPSSDQENKINIDSSLGKGPSGSRSFDSPQCTSAPTARTLWSGAMSGRKRPRTDGDDRHNAGDVEMSCMSACGVSSAKKSRPLEDVTNVAGARASVTSPSLQNNKTMSSPAPVASAINQDISNAENIVLSSKESISCAVIQAEPVVAVAKEASVPSSAPLAKAAVIRLEISKEEQGMNGAPEGELFEVTVLADDELMVIDSASTSEVVEALLAGASLSASATWADKFEAITNIRRVLKSQGATMITSDAIAAAICAVVSEGLESLRSTNVRNALLCLRNLLKCYKDMDAQVSRDGIMPLLQSLIRRCHTGARFICDLALEVSREVAPNVPLPIVIAAAEGLFAHKNADISKRAYVILCETISFTSNDELQHLESTVLVLLKDGLKSKSPDARNACKLRLKSMMERLGEEAFYALLDSSMTPTEAASLKREITTPTASASSSAAPARPVLGNNNGPRGAPASIKSRLQAFQKKSTDENVIIAPKSSDISGEGEATQIN